jgi:hypothetical protein
MNPSKVPVLVLGFNRPDGIRQLFAMLSVIQPEQLFFAVDGPRAGNLDDHERVDQTRKLIELIDWDCDIQTQFQSENLGCARGVTAGIDWFFSKVTEGIILEDDVIPVESFFQFSAELLVRYRDDQRVWCISGSNRLPSGELPPDYSYRFSAIPQVWGWATWRDRWEKYSLDISNWRANGLSHYKLLKTVGYSPSAFAFWSANFDLMARMAVDTWDTQMVNAAMRNSALAVIPNVNLVDNIGWGTDATHTVELPPYIQPAGEVQFPLKHPEVSVDTKADRAMNKLVYQATPIGLARQFQRYRNRSR